MPLRPRASLHIATTLATWCRGCASQRSCRAAASGYHQPQVLLCPPAPLAAADSSDALLPWYKSPPQLLCSLVCRQQPDVSRSEASPLQ